MPISIEKCSIKATPHQWRKLAKECFVRDGGRCQICGACGPVQSHHIIPHGRLVLDVLDNLLTLCHVCHRGVHDHLDGYPTVDDLIERYWDRVKRFLS